jgi:hypothetical protein
LSADLKIAWFDEKLAKVGIIWEAGMLPVAVDLPIDGAGYYPPKQELLQYLSGFIPRYTRTERDKQLERGIPNVDAVRDLVDPELMVMDFVDTPPDLNAILDQRAKDDFRNGVKDVLHELGIL